MNTNLAIKKKYFPIFCKKVWNRLVDGREKYKIPANDLKEGTDLIEEIVPDFQLADVIKYLIEYRNKKKEKCLLDGAGFLFVKWCVDNDKFSDK